jgi:glycosyltransferase involved in cell wall biosynthesis
MRILFFGKRHYTGRDTLRDRFGRIYKFPEMWAAAGNTVTLFLIDYRGLSIEYSVLDGLNVRSHGAFHPKTWTAPFSEATQLQPDVVVASGDCQLGLLGLSVARRSKAKFVFDVYDDYRTFSAYRMFLGFNAYDLLVTRADLVVYASGALAATHHHPNRFHVAPNGVDPEVFHPMDQREAQRLSGLSRPDTRWIGYFGGLNRDRGVTDLVAAVGRLHQRNDRIRLALCGHTPEDSIFDRPWVNYFGNVAHERIPHFINACDVVALPYRRSLGLDMAASCKIAEYLFCQRPIVATKSPNLLSNFPEQSGQLGDAICNPGDVDDLTRALLLQLTHPRIANVPEEHTWQCIAGAALEEIRTTLSSRASAGP